MNVLAGTSGYSYKEWKGTFYPERLPNDRMLEHYASRLPAVEINNTFYRMPRASVLEAWAAQVPQGFRFAIKASRRITHLKRLGDAGEEMAYLLETVAGLGQRLGVVLYQLPPFMKKDLGRLEAFLGLIDDGAQAVFEFRHETWFDEDVYECLRRKGCSLCVSDEDDAAQPAVVPTSKTGYLRLRREAYSDEALAAWADAIRASGWNEAYVFFKHEDAGAGPALAQRFLDLWR